MKRQQTQLDRVSRVLSLAESGRLISPAASPTPPPHEGLLASPLSVEPKVSPVPKAAPSSELKAGLHEQLQELACSLPSEPHPMHPLAQGYTPHPQLPPSQAPMPALQAGGSDPFQAPYQTQMPQQHQMVQNYNQDLGPHPDSALPSVMLPWPEYMPP